MGYVRRNFLVPLPYVPDFAELNAYLLDCSERDARQRQRWGRTVQELWQEERASLRPLPEQLPEACITVTAKVNRRQQVRLDGNWYSVPPEYVGRLVTVHAYVFRVTMAYQDGGIASHARSYGREEEVLEPHHYLPVLLRKPGAFARATPILKWPLPAVYEAYYQQLQERREAQGEPGNISGSSCSSRTTPFRKLLWPWSRPRTPAFTAMRWSKTFLAENRLKRSASSRRCGRTGWTTSTCW